MDEELTRQLRDLIKRMVAEQLAENAGVKPLDITRDPSGFAVIRGSNVELEVFDTGKPQDRVNFCQFLTSKESPNLAFGLLDIEESSFDWYLGYDEVDYILKGTWEITIKGKTYTGHAGDTMFIPHNTAVTFSSPDHATVFYAAYPANWEELCEESPS